MKQSALSTVLLLMTLFSGTISGVLSAQVTTVPVYTYSMVQGEYGMVTQAGVADPGPYGGYSVKEETGPYNTFIANGFRWWGFPSYPLLICGTLPKLNFPGDHGVFDNTSASCANPPIGFMGSWGGVYIDQEQGKIWCLAGAKKSGAPTVPYCIPNPYGTGQLCYNLPPTWGKADSYGFIRKVTVIKSTGTLKKGDPVQLKVKLSIQGNTEGQGTFTCQGVLMLNRQGFAMEYMNWATVSDLSGAPMLARFNLNLNQKDSTVVTLTVGDTIVTETAFLNRIAHERETSPSEAEGWAGKEPLMLKSDINYLKSDSVKKIIIKNGNCLAYNVECLTAGVILENVSVDGPGTDEDKDGIIDSEEKGPGGDNGSFDGNADGIPDYKQAGVASFHTYNWSNYITMEVPSGSELSEVNVTGNPSPSNAPQGAEFPWGFFDFSIDDVDPGESITVRITLHDADPADKYYKYGITSENKTPHWYEFNFDGQTGAEISGNIVLLHFIDGFRGDDDITVNGYIKEPGGPAKTGSTGVRETNDYRGFYLYPNPADNQLIIKADHLPEGNYLITVSSLTGKRVIEKKVEVFAVSQSVELFVDMIPGGVYLVTMSGNGKVYRSKLILK